MLIQHFYDNRSPVSYLKVDEMPLAYKHIITQYKRYSLVMNPGEFRHKIDIGIKTEAQGSI